MSAMVLAHFPMPWLICLALVLFFSVFLAILVRLTAGSNTMAYDRLRNLPLTDEGEMP